MMPLSSPRSVALGRVRCLWAAVALLALTALAGAEEATLKVAVYDVPPYGHVEADGTIDGASVDLWRRVAQALDCDYRFIPVADMEAILTGLERKDYDAAIGAITITPGRLARVDFSYPAHRSGVAAAFRRERGPIAAFAVYASVVSELSPLIAITAVLLVAMGLAMWLVEKSKRAPIHESAVASWRDGDLLGGRDYDDRRLWRHDAEDDERSRDRDAVDAGERRAGVDLVDEPRLEDDSRAGLGGASGRRSRSGRQAACGSGALVRRRVFGPATASLRAVQRLALRPRGAGAGETDAVVNSIGALQYAIANGFTGTIEPPQGVLAPAYMAIALPPGSALKRRLDATLVEITASAEWRRVEASYFAP